MLTKECTDHMCMTKPHQGTLLILLIIRWVLEVIQVMHDFKCTDHMCMTEPHQGTLRILLIIRWVLGVIQVMHDFKCTDHMCMTEPHQKPTLYSSCIAEFFLGSYRS